MFSGRQVVSHWPETQPQLGLNPQLAMQGFLEYTRGAFQCSICMMKFVNTGSLNLHMKTHTQDKPYKCEYCAKSFSQRGNLNLHIRTHTREKPYKCDLCDTSYAQSSNLTKHKLRAHNAIWHVTDSGMSKGQDEGQNEDVCQH